MSKDGVNILSFLRDPKKIGKFLEEMIEITADICKNEKINN